MSARRHVSRRLRWLSVTVAASVVLTAWPLTQSVAADAGASAEPPLTLRSGKTVWWDGEFPADKAASVPWLAPAQFPPPPEACGVTLRCQDHGLRVEGPVEAGSRLRVALTNWPGHPGPGTATIDLAVLLPNGEACRPAHNLAATHGAQVSVTYGFSVEAFIRPGGRDHCDREVVNGTYVVRVIGTITDSGTVAGYRVRAALEKPVRAQSDRRLLPDLVPEAPPYGFAFGCQPAPDGDAFGNLFPDSPAHETTPGWHPGKDRVCLRYGFTYGNAGDGLLDLTFDPRTTGRETPIRQRLYRADATPGRYEDHQVYEEWPAGTAHFHATHRHWHISGFYDAQLLKVRDTGDGLDPAHSARKAVKQGVCTSPWFMLEFERVLPDEPDVPSTGCDLNEYARPALEEVRIPLAAGWADVYDTIQPDNFVDVTDELPEPAGIRGELQYVLRFRVNPDATREAGAGNSPLSGGGYIAESDITNNTSYAHIRITAADDDSPHESPYEVCVLGRGFGDDPWASNAQPVPVGGGCSSAEGTGGTAS